MRGPEFGSVPEPVKMPPRPWPLTQKKVGQQTTGSKKRSWSTAEQAGPNPTISEPMASSQVVQTPPLPKWLPKLLRKWEYALGSPDDMPVMALETDVGVRLFGQQEQDRRQRPVAAPDQQRRHRPADALSGGRGRDADARFRLRRSWLALTVARPSGRSARRWSTEPGAPVRADADPVKIRPRPSPEEPDAEGPEERERQGRVARSAGTASPIRWPPG